MKNLSKFCPCLKANADNPTTSEENNGNSADVGNRQHADGKGLRVPTGGGARGQQTTMGGGRQRAGSLTSLASSTQQIPSIHTMELYSPDPDIQTTHSDCSFAISHERLAFLKKSSSIVVNIPSSRGSLSSLNDSRWNSRNTLHLSRNQSAGGMPGSPSETSKSVDSSSKRPSVELTTTLRTSSRGEAAT